MRLSAVQRSQGRNKKYIDSIGGAHGLPVVRRVKSEKGFRGSENDSCMAVCGFSGDYDYIYDCLRKHI